MRSEEARRKGGSIYCGYCASEIDRAERLPKCSICARKIESYQQSTRLSGGGAAHSECAAKARRGNASVFCSICGKQTDRFKLLPGGKAICARCDSSKAQAEKGRTALASIVDAIGSMLG